MHHLQGNAIPAGHVKNPLSDSYKMLSLRDSYVHSSKSWKFQIFRKNMPLRDKCSWSILQNLVWGREPQVHTVAPNFTIMALEMWVKSTKIIKICNFCYNPNFFGPISFTARGYWNFVGKYPHRGCMLVINSLWHFTRLLQIQYFVTWYVHHAYFAWLSHYTSLHLLQ